jgi:hypothetical protein
MCPTGKSKWGWGAHACGDCASGLYSDTVGADRCKECPMGTYTLSGANSVCVKCPGNSTTGIIGAQSASHCRCNPGFIGPPAPLEPRGPPCTPCPAGTDRPYLESDNCIECEPGKYAPVPGTPFCLDCPVSKYADGYGNTACMDCAVGYTGPTGGPCVACAAATYKDSVGSAACTACREQSTSPEASTSSSACLCNAGLFLFSVQCYGCQPGQYKDVIGNQACTACPANTYPEDIPNADWDTPRLSSSCMSCPSGSSCTYPWCNHIRDCRCDAGHSAPQRESVCLPCDAGSSAADIGYTYCPPCQPGTYQDQTGATACKQCPPGTSSDYTDTGGPVTCTGCPEAFDPMTNACVSCANKTNNAVWSSAISSCVCEIGFGLELETS